MDKLLSIGEVSKLKGMHIKSLRYYDKIGILKPIYVNPHTGYRYYSLDQMITLDAIWTCLELGIPLKSFHKYTSETGKIYIDRILHDGHQLANQKITKIKEALCKLESFSANIANYQEVKENDGEYLRSLALREIITTPWTGVLDDNRLFMKKITELYIHANKRNLFPLCQQGFLGIKTEGEIEWYVFLEVIVRGTLTTLDIHILPQGDYHCRIFSGDDAGIIQTQEYLQSDFKEGTVIVAVEMYDTSLDSTPAPLEIQVFK